MAKVTVLMAVYNAGEYLQIAVESILTQTFSDFNFLIINDASTDTSADFLEQLNDPRIKLIHNQTNLGLTRSLNVGLQQISTEYIARLDADDVAHPQRLEKQIRFLDKHPDYILVGSSYRLIDGESKVIDSVIKPMDHVELMWLFHTRTALEHGSVTYRHGIKNFPPLQYDAKYRTAQDYDFWLRMLKQGKGAIMPDLLLDYRQHSQNITSTLPSQQMQNIKSISAEFLQTEYDLSHLENVLATSTIEFLNNKNSMVFASYRMAWQGMRLLIEKYCSNNPLTNNQKAFIRRRAHGQLWHCALNKRQTPFAQKLLLFVCSPFSLVYLISRRLRRENHLTPQCKFENE
jgi:glycosyltransferase involved in cell wall biosynthesis